MIIKRDDFLTELRTVQSGLSPKETTEQSDCFVFQKGEVLTFNDRVACRTTSKLSITGAINAKKLLEMLDRWPEETIEFKRTKGRLNFKGKAKRGYFITQDEITLPIVDVETPKVWKKLPEDFKDGVGLAQGCACSIAESPLLSCIHLTPNWIEACDATQAGRYAIKLPLKKKSVLVQREALRQITNIATSSIGLTKNWVHFKDEELTVSCRVQIDEFPSERLTKIFSAKGSPVILPKGLKNLVDRLKVFIDDDATFGWLEVEITPSYVQVTSRGNFGSQTERKKIKYKGKPLKFHVNPQLFRDLTDKNDRCTITKRAIKVCKDNFQYVTSLWLPNEKDED